jgi:hypothetical protein
VAAPTAGLTFEAALELTLDMGTERFIAMVENAKLKKARREEVSDLECVCIDEQAILRRISWCLCRVGDVLVAGPSCRERGRCRGGPGAPKGLLGRAEVGDVGVTPRLSIV